MAVLAKKALGFGLSRCPLRPGDLVGVDLPKFDQALGDGEHGDFINGVEAATIAEQVEGK